MNINLECFFIFCEGGKINYKKDIIDITGETESPDDQVLKLIKDLSTVDYIHSTSWRYDKFKGIIITYILNQRFLTVDLDTFLDLKILKVKKQVDPLKPCQISVSDENVLAHAMRHLCYINDFPLVNNKVICSIVGSSV